MKFYYVFVLGTILLMSACSVNQSQLTSPNQVSFDQSAAIAVKKAIYALDLPTQLSTIVTKTDKITIESIDVSTTTDNDIIAAVEDAVISQYVGSGYHVLERDYDMIVRNYVNSGKLNDSNVGLTLGEDSPVALSLTKPASFDLTPAGKVISYRVNEIGVVYSVPQQTSATLGSSEVLTAGRTSRVIMNVRVENPVTNQILFSKTLEGEYKDTLEVKNVRLLENIHYQFHSYKNPISKNLQSPDVNILTQQTETKKKSSGGSSGGLYLLILSTLVAVGVAALIN